jgi:acetyl-CoA C-acetyltransferase
MTDPRTPILVGCGQVTDLDTPPEKGHSAIDMIERAVRLAATDTGASDAVLRGLDSLCILRLYTDTSWRFESPFGRCTNPPAAVARRLGVAPRRLQYTSPGGNMPQYMVNRTAEEIANGETEMALIAGGEALRTMREARKVGIQLDWNEEAEGAYEEVGDMRPGVNDYEMRHGMRAPIFNYPLFENAIRAHRGRSMEAHMQSIGRLMAGFARVAHDNPLAVRREGFSAERIATVTPDNRYIGFPYTRLMNSNPYIDQSAALIMTSVGKARELGIDPSKWVFLHGCGDAWDHWWVTERVNYYSSPAIRTVTGRAFAMAGKTAGDMDFLDLYSCFPSAIQIGAAEIGIAEDDPRGLTVTGGLPFFGGPGNNYVTHSIAEMMNRVRSRPGSFGLCTANGHNVTKHGAGIYSTTPIEGAWRREDPAVGQAEIDAMPKPPLTEVANGPARIETWTVMHRPDGPELGIVIGRLDDGNVRFVANTPADTETLMDLQENGDVGRRGMVTHSEGKNLFVLK